MKFRIYVCDGPSCGVTHDSDKLVEQARAAGADVECFTCFDHCDDGPNLFVRQLDPNDPDPEEPDSDIISAQRGFYSHMSAEKLARVLEQHLAKGEPVDDLLSEY